MTPAARDGARAMSRTTPLVAGLALVVAAAACAAERSAPLAEIRGEVERGLAAEAAAGGFAERAAAVHRLVELHGRLADEPAFAAGVAATGLRRRIAVRLGRVGRELVPVAAGESSGAGQAGARAEVSGAGGRRAEAQALIDLIQATVRPETWDVNGGRGSIVYFANGHGLVVRAPADVHDELGGLLRQLR